MNGYIVMGVLLIALAFVRTVWLCSVIGAIAAAIIHFQVWLHAKGEFSFIIAVGLSPFSIIIGAIAGGVAAAIGKRWLPQSDYKERNTNSSE